jgi:hypothetical protein
VKYDLKERYAMTAQKALHILVMAALIASPVAAQSLQPSMPSCLPQSGHGATSVQLDPNTEWSSVRTYFRALPDGNEHFVEMIAGPDGSYAAVYPEVAEKTASVESYIRATAADGSTMSSEPVNLPVTAQCVPTLTPELAAAAAAITIGETTLDQSGQTPDGFSCKGVESRVDTNGIVGSHIACREERIAAAPMAAGMSQAAKTALLVGGGVAIGAGVGYAIGNEDCEDCPVSPSTP